MHVFILPMVAMSYMALPMTLPIFWAHAMLQAYHRY